MPATYANGKICYIEIPATDNERSADFYTKVFGWTTRKRGDRHLAFDDTTGQVSGTWVTGRPPSPAPGVLIYIMVDDIDVTIDAILANGGEIVWMRRRSRRGSAIREGMSSGSISSEERASSGR
jgi:predicted enzyme related to lactoylglutathione lyase